MTFMGHSKLYHTQISSLKTISSNNVFFTKSNLLWWKKKH